MPKKKSETAKLVKQDARKDSEVSRSKKEGQSKKEGWSAEELGEQSSYEGTTEISRRLRRGDESVGDPNARDVAGAIPEKDMPHGREVRRRQHKSAKKKLKK
jgi:hypothetical protein